jgi:hypothetical protein
MTDSRSIRKTDSSLSSGISDEEATARGSKSRRNSNTKDSKKINPIKFNTSLDSNGESEDEEINRLQKIIQDQAKELNEEKLASRKVSLISQYISFIISTFLL